MQPSDPIATFSDVIAVRETEKGLLCRPVVYPNRQFWCAKSMIAPISDIQHVGDRGALVVSKWWAETSRVHLNFEARE
jgi:hypothetical protein